MKKKIKTLEELKKIILQKKLQGKKIVLCHGVFDLFHYGHLQHFKKAKSYGDILVVTITKDQYIEKGPNRPYFNSLIRKNLLSELTIVDYVAEVDSPSAINSIENIKPDFYVKGQDYKNQKDITGKIDKEIKEVKKYGGKIIYTNEIVFSSSKLLHMNNLTLNNDQNKEINKIKKNYNYYKIEKILDELKKIKVLIIGEFIIDKYNFCEALGKSGKDPIMMFKRGYSNEYIGGVGAIANNIVSYVHEAKMITYIKAKKDINHIKNKLNNKIKQNFIELKSVSTIKKEKFIDLYSNAKLIGFYNYEDRILKSDDKKIFSTIKKEIGKYDIVIVADYGHGMISDNSAKYISKTEKKIFLNLQINAANISHHNLLKFPKAFCIIINESEIRHHLRNSYEDLNSLIKKFSKLVSVKFIVTTKGSKGCLLYDVNKNKIFQSTSYANKVIDKIGAGDTLLALFSIFFHVSKDPELSLFLSSVGAGKKVEYMANSKIIDKKTLLNIVKYLI
jgi:rfaE bifunctional protein nucleotidyltransferase chain/domain